MDPSIRDLSKRSHRVQGLVGIYQARLAIEAADNQPTLLIEEIFLARQIEKPTLRTRGGAFDHIEEAGKNPAIWSEPEMPSLVAALAKFVS